jgi:low temperature requirement protein LtrA
VIVVAVAHAAEGLHHALKEGHAASGLHTYAMVFFGVWWAWVNFTWFASAYDNDDVAYRLLVLVQLTGALVLAGGITSFQHGDLRIGVLGYVIMRVALVAQWLRVSRGDPARRPCALRYALGVMTVQAAWVGLLLLPGSWLPAVFWGLALVEMAVPAWAERATPTPWHPHHIAERYGLFTLITLGESILAASMAVESATASGARAASLAPIIVGGLLIVFSFWWLYFERPGHEVLRSLPTAFLWGYGHYFVFGASAAVGAGLAVSVDQATGQGAITARAAGAAVALPVAVFLASLWLLLGRSDDLRESRSATALIVLAVLAAPFTPSPVLVTGLAMAGLVAVKLVLGRRPAEATG